MARPQQRKGERGGKKRSSEFEEEVIQVDRVTRVIAGGKRMRFRATVVIGDKKGRVGFAIGKANEVSVAIQKGVSRAKKNLITVPLIRDTIPHEIENHFKGSEIFLKPAAPGTGIIAGGPARKILELAGVKNVLSKFFGSSNRINCSTAVFQALQNLKPARQQTQQTKEKLLTKEI